jgi:hypothetical protein
MSDGQQAAAAADECAGIAPYPPAPVPVYVLDEAGNVFPAKERSAEEDFKQAVRSLNIGSAAKDTADAAEIDETAAAESTKETAAAAAAATSTDTAASSDDAQALHPLEPTLRSFGMALSELNQLINLIDLVRGGEFMSLERVAKAKVLTEQSTTHA